MAEFAEDLVPAREHISKIDGGEPTDAILVGMLLDRLVRMIHASRVTGTYGVSKRSFVDSWRTTSHDECVLENDIRTKKTSVTI